MTVRKLLLLEDNEALRSSWVRSIEEFNDEGGGTTLFPVEAATAAEASEVILSGEVHCAILDLRVPDGVHPEASADGGHAVIRALMDRHQCPFVVLTGYLDELDDEFRNLPYRVIEKEGGAITVALGWLVEQAPLMDAIFQTKNVLNKEIGALFYQSLWARWQTTWREWSEPDEIATIMARQLAGHIEARLSGIGHYHREEFYVSPAIAGRPLDTGDVVIFESNATESDESESDGTWQGMYVVVTPRCDLAREAYPRDVILAPCRLVGSDWKTIEDGVSVDNNSAKKRESAKKKLGAMLTQNCGAAKHFLPPLGGDGPWYAHFKESRTFREDASTLVASRRWSVAPAFVPNLVQRFGNYYSRIGQPELAPTSMF